MLNAIALETVIFRYSESGEYYAEVYGKEDHCECPDYSAQGFDF